MQRELAMGPGSSSSNPDVTASQDQSNATRRHHKRAPRRNPPLGTKRKLCPDSPLLYLQMRRDPASPSDLLRPNQSAPDELRHRHSFWDASRTSPPSPIAPKPTKHRKWRCASSLLRYLRLARREEVDEINVESWLDI